MECRRQLVTWLMLGIIVAIPVVTIHASAASSAPASARCHEHGPKMPSQPAGFACCERAHRAALPVGFDFQRILEPATHFLSIAGLQEFAEHRVIAVPPFAYSPPEFALRV